MGEEPAGKPGALGHASAARLLPLLAVLLAVILHFAPFLFLGEHMVPFDREFGAVTGIPNGGDLRALHSPHRWNFWNDTSAITLQYPFAAFTGASLREGHLPAWNPFIGCGSPAMGNGTYHPFSPFLALFYALPNPWTYTLGLLLGCLFGACGYFVWLRRFGFSPWVQTWGAALWAFSPAAWRYMTLSEVWASWWLGWLLWAWDEGEEDAHRPSWLAALMLAGMAYSGHAEEALILAAGSAAFLLLQAWLQPGWKEHLKRTSMRIATSGGLAVILTAVHWLPLLAHVRESTSYKVAGAVKTSYGYSLADFFSPRTELYTSPLVWGLVFLSLPFVWKERRLRACLCVTVLAIVLLLNPLAYVGLGKILTLGGALPSRYAHLLFWSFLIPVLCLAANRLFSANVNLRVRVAAIACGFLPFAVFALAKSFDSRGEASVPGPQWWAFYGIAALLLAQGTLASRSSAKVALVAGLALVALDPFVWFYGRLDRSNPYAFATTAASPTFSCFNDLDPMVGGAGPPTFGRVREDLARNHGRFASVPVIPHSSNQCLASNLSSLWRVSDARQTEPLHLKRFRDLYMALAPEGHVPRVTFLSLDGFSPEALGRFAVRWLAHPKDLLSGEFTWERIPQARPRAFLARRILVAANESEALKLVKKSVENGDSPGTVVLESWTGPADLGASDISDDVSWVTDEPTQVTLQTRSASPAVLVLLDSFAEGWKAFVDGHPAPILHADVAFRAVALAPGDHEVRFVFHPSALRWGLILTCLGWLGLLVWAGTGWTNRSRCP